MPNHDIFGLSGETPLVLLKQMARTLPPKVMLKLDYMNPACSHYYRVASALIADAEERNLIHPGMTLVDWTCGNSGIALAMAGVRRGYKLLLAASDKISREKQEVLRAIGAELVITPSNVLPGEPRSCMNVAESLVKSIPNAFYAGINESPVSIRVYSESLGNEIFSQSDGRLTHLFVPLFSGAMVSGLARFLKAKNPLIRIIGVEPQGSVYAALSSVVKSPLPVLSELEEIGAQSASASWEPSAIDEVIQVSDYDALNCGRELFRMEAVFAGAASGAVLSAALHSAAGYGKDDCLVAVMSDFGGFSLSKMYNDEWMRTRGFYRKAKSALEQITAEDILQLKVRRELIVAFPEHTLAEVFEMMKQNDVSQLPIVSYNSPIGSISENKILSILIENDEAMNSKVVGFMEQPFPVCPPDATISELSNKLQQSASGVLINMTDGKLQLLTKSDLIDALTHK